jgi:hypothetical protein
MFPRSGIPWSWYDEGYDWLNGTLYIQRRIVHQVVDEVKTPESQRLMYIDAEIWTC